MAALERPSAIRPSTSRSRGVRAAERGRGAPTGDELGDHLRVHRGAAAGDAADGVDELGGVGDPVLQQVADAAPPSASSSTA